jgi:hypothetical protein
MDYETNAQLAESVHSYVKTLPNSDKLRFAAYMLSLVDSIQQEAVIPEEVLDEDNSLFDDVESDDPLEPGYHLHNLLENLAENFESLAASVDQIAASNSAEALRRAALAKLTAEEKDLLGL